MLLFEADARGPKVPLDISGLVNGAYSRAKNIILLRDPRDEFLSKRAFNQKRGTLVFGWKEDDTGRSFALRMLDARRSFLRQYAELRVDQRRMKFRYEDIILAGDSVVESLGSWLGLELSREQVTEAAPRFSHHTTTPTAEQSVQRWRVELEPELQDIFRSELREELEAVGYET